jgi:two-component system sensor kinase FixL
VFGDRVQLQQVVLNLVLNACDAMNHTHVTQRLLALATAADDGFVELVVSDRGTGIPDGQLERVFEPFVTFREQGLGLGLAISRSIVTAHGGSIRAVNNADGGATFRCLLPVAPER